MTFTRFRICFIALLLVACSRPVATNTLAIVGATVIDVRNGAGIPNATVLIDNGGITAVAAEAEYN